MSEVMIIIKPFVRIIFLWLHVYVTSPIIEVKTEIKIHFRI